jgi:lipoate-protein ligase A
MTFRLIVDPAQDGPTNMARDEAILAAVSAGQALPTLRFYRWSPPTISLGYFQKYADYEALPPPAGDLPVVRRQTGGGAILHDLELTYSIALPLDHPLAAGEVNALYQKMHDAVIRALAEFDVDSNRCGETIDTHAQRGPFFCFGRRHCLDVLVGDDKIAGSAQRRTRTAVLQHGSIILDSRYEQQPSHVGLECTDQAVDKLTHLIQRCLIDRTGMSFFDDPLSPAENDQTESLRAKYAGLEWSRRK